MTPTQATEVLAKLTAGYDKKLSDATARIWLEQLTPLEHEKALGVVRIAIGTSARFPTIAEFRAVYASHNPPQPFTPPDEPKDGRLPAAEVRARIAAMKAQLR